ncbi:hypothetical protein VIGAN_10182300 [Vigna angularis var. angularis]|uniref:Cyclin C-terminal domain-containing protein n=1 Tax=Vigna angularis var. angularis TaxID=157739 RepID=A0A0S3T564_PHAAN|nr:hypothetical protein VIGAN_10182300 [Vigna angularis var. angularis]
MELLVLSTLEWKMNPVTPICFFQHFLTRLDLKRHLHWEFMCGCQHVLLSVIADSRVMSYLPSTLSAAIMIHVIEEIEPLNAAEYRSQLLGLLKSNEDKSKFASKGSDQNTINALPGPKPTTSNSTESKLPRNEDDVFSDSDEEEGRDTQSKKAATEYKFMAPHQASEEQQTT